MESIIWTEGTERIIDSLSNEPLIGEYVFVGGSALSYHIKHRLSEDIDLFEAEESLKRESIDVIMNNMIKKGYYIEDVGVPFSQTHRKFLVLGVKVEFAAHGKSFLSTENTLLKNNLRVANLETIAGMKAYTITARKEIRDLYDNYILINKTFGLKFLIDKAKELYGGVFSEKAYLAALVAADKVFKDEYIEKRLKPKEKISKNEMCSFFKKKVEEYSQNPTSPDAFSQELKKRMDKSKGPKR